MKKVILTSSLLGAVVMGLAVGAPVATASAKPALSATAVTYHAAKKAATFAGKASPKVKKVVLQYGKTKKVTATVKARKFKVTKAFSGYRDFKLYGVNQKGQRVTNVYTYGPSRYATKAPTMVQIDRSGVPDTLLVTLNVPKASVITIDQRDHRLVKQYCSSTPALFHLNGITAKKYQVTVTAKQADRKTSPVLKLPVVKRGLIMVARY